MNETRNTPTNQSVQPVPLAEHLTGPVRRCRICNYRCELSPGQSGVCQVRHNQAGTLRTVNYGLVSKADLERIESRGFYHLFPGVKVFSLGGYGANFPVPAGQTGYLNIPGGSAARYLPVEKLARFVIEQQCRGIIFAYNEPAMWFEYLLDACKSIRANGMFTAMVTNGYMTLEALEMVGHYIDGLLVEVNAFSERSFNILTGQDNFQKVLETARRAQHKYKSHLEISTKIVPGVNDSDSEIELLATWIKQGLGENVAWHLSSPQPGMQARLQQIKQIGLNCGLNYIYLKDAPPVNEFEEDLAALFDSTVNGNTYCHKCHRKLIDRQNAEVSTPGLSGNKCANCGTILAVHNTLWKL
ncbi:MAG: hypothetical protein JWP00_4730 [Chloroflexi bacterium]|nr:hypothetical protein [Chloroflexota bacterium]